MNSGEDTEFIRKHIKQYTMIEKIMNTAKNYNVQKIPVPVSFELMVRSLDVAYHNYKYCSYGKQLTKK